MIYECSKCSKEYSENAVEITLDKVDIVGIDENYNTTAEERTLVLKCDCGNVQKYIESINR